jgi:hypothetical protein
MITRGSDERMFSAGSEGQDGSDEMRMHKLIQKGGLNFVSLYIKHRTSDKYDVKYI